MADRILDSLQDRLDAAEVALKEFEPITAALDVPDRVLFEREQRTKREIETIVAALQKQINDISSVSNPLKDRANALREQVAEDERFQEQTGGRKKLTDAQRRAAISEAEKLEREASNIETKGLTAETAPAAVKKIAKRAAQTTAKKAAAPAAAQRPAAQAVTPAMRAAGVVTPEAAAVRPPTTTPQPAVTPTPTTTPGAGAGTATERAGRTTRRGRKAAEQKAAEWASIIQQEFGSLWDVYNNNADVKAVLDKSVKEGWFNDADKLAASLQNTGWYRTTEQSARQFAISQSTDPATVEDRINTEVETFRQSALANGFTFDDMTLRRLATDKIKYGWSAQQATNAIGSEAVAQAQGRGAQGMRDLRSGFVGQKLRQIARSYAQKPSESQIDTFINDIMTGKKTEQQFIDLMRSSAKTQFRSLSSAIDQGQDVETAMYGYQQAAQSTLGNVIDVSQIDWTSDKWNKALNYRDEKTGEFRQMDLWEWNKYLRKLPEWQQTDEAKQTYQNVAYSLAQGFGKIA